MATGRFQIERSHEASQFRTIDQIIEETGVFCRSGLNWLDRNGTNEAMANRFRVSHDHVSDMPAVLAVISNADELCEGLFRATCGWQPTGP
ncbi:hypothetical protein Poly59_14060 [Rubripirellula reticaptiva]|uniref:Uncharacterized protein n=2 Tax=Rubripirellula reticaptiva TaxID=2528013 RepID=A0A5C6F3N0_9BACT|nr:hypothetical protein Poly59_14060 [Rubripirellula reticaptiva]